ncbi:hypothetical protein Poly24_40220 [Rosistilla carotiformis]|uniref:Uncharacterized protein n=1 Tax=Rosistilla carotiformis TaxID=2528017 RepID=A0A518JXN2_9BACT|nr:hypothetical protein [Rosistilla carotiformis]QDV70302.1 hypothetical protein Poly24_40220 [Rosistilla carotiformis]
MQLDRTHVVVRPRSNSELCDLTLLLMRQYCIPLCVAFLAGVLPLALMNAALIGWLPIEAELEGIGDDETFAWRSEYLFLMASLIFLEAPLAGVFATLYIGQAVFEQRPTWRQVARDAWATWHRWVWKLGVLRGPVPAVLLLVWTWSLGDADGLAVFFMMLLLMYVGTLRAFRPHTPEILLLERCPLRRGATGAVTYSHRSHLFHTPVAGDSVNRFVTMLLLSGMLTVSLFFAMIFLQGVFAQRWSFNIVAQLVYVPAAMWIVAGYTVLFRFLCYLDNRIRLEGWDVELGLRAEVQRQFGDPQSQQPAPGVGG